MTVCIAAMCDVNSILTASDRMLTAGNIKFEPEQSKVAVLTSSIVAMTAGDSYLQSDLIQLTAADVNEHISATPDKWLDVRVVANWYERHVRESTRKGAETEFLFPLGLDSTTFLTLQKTLDPTLVREVSKELLNYESLYEVEAIFCGVDTTGAHIYVVDSDGVTCRDAVGFAAIGIGADHANSQLMFAKHTRYKPLAETLLSVYAAKKRSEVAPGVGAETDMYSIGPNLGSATRVDVSHVESLERIWGDWQRQEAKSLSRTRKTVEKYVKEIAQSATQKEQGAGQSEDAGSPPADSPKV